MWKTPPPWIKRTTGAGTGLGAEGAGGFQWQQEGLRMGANGLNGPRMVQKCQPTGFDDSGPNSSRKTTEITPQTKQNTPVMMVGLKRGESKEKRVAFDPNGLPTVGID